jgi:hypothetical protein
MPFIWFVDGVGFMRASLSLLNSPDASKQNAMLQLYDKDSRARLTATVDDSGGHIRTFDASGKEQPAPK